MPISRCLTGKLEKFHPAKILVVQVLDDLKNITRGIF